VKPRCFWYSRLTKVDGNRVTELIHINMVPGWATTHTHLHAPRRSHDHNPIQSKRSRSSSPDDAAERPRRSSSDATPRQTPATTRFLSSPTPNNDQDPNKNVLTAPQDVFSSSKRLGFFADKLSSSLSGTGHSAANLKSSLYPGQLLHPHSHTRNDSTLGSVSTTTSPTMAAASSLSNVSKSHTSPSKARLRPNVAMSDQLLMFIFFIIGFLRAHI
jgi:hypothetical protein